MAHVIDGKAIAAAMNEQTAGSAALLRARGIIPALAVVVATEDESAAWYVRSIERAAARAGIECRIHRLPPPVGRPQIAARLGELSQDPAVHGIICQSPLPEGVALAAVGSSIAVRKDVDGANPASLGMLAAGLPDVFPPATAAAIMEILRHENVPLSGRRAVVIGRSSVVGKPAALLLLAENATVTICHSRTRDLPAVCREADVLVVAVGQPEMVGAGYVAPGAVVIDVGTNPTSGGGLVGDVDTGAVGGVASAITPVPGGVGPVTTAQLMNHAVRAALSGSYGHPAGGWLMADQD
jgi:methylenetetrahydrofolate dehydrogenase (NADP+) / methenyltetrahydrofolate cyclohydrolase